MSRLGKLTKIVYAISLLITVIAFYFPRLNDILFLFKLRQIDEHLDLLGLSIDVFYVLIVLIIGIIIGHRFYELLMGRVILFSHNASLFVNIMRKVGLLLIYLSATTVIGGIMLLIGFDLYFHNHVKITHLLNGNDIGTIFRYSSPTALSGLMIFEFSRLKSFEYHLINR